MKIKKIFELKNLLPVFLLSGSCQMALGSEGNKLIELGMSGVVGFFAGFGTKKVLGCPNCKKKDEIIKSLNQTKKDSSLEIKKNSDEKCENKLKKTKCELAKANFNISAIKNIIKRELCIEFEDSEEFKKNLQLFKENYKKELKQVETNIEDAENKAKIKILSYFSDDEHFVEQGLVYKGKLNEVLARQYVLVNFLKKESFKDIFRNLLSNDLKSDIESICSNKPLVDIAKKFKEEIAAKLNNKEVQIAKLKKSKKKFEFLNKKLADQNKNLEARIENLTKNVKPIAFGKE